MLQSAQEVGDAVRAHRHEGKALGANQYKKIKKSNPPVGLSAVWPNVPDAQILRDSLARCSGAGRELHGRKRPEYVDALEGIANPNAAEVNDCMHFLCALNPKNKLHRPFLKRVLVWLAELQEDWPVHLRCVAKQFDEGCLRVLGLRNGNKCKFIFISFYLYSF